MGDSRFCQSCCMPLDNEEMLGTETDGSKNKEYCKYCYQNGAFVNPDLTIDEMRGIVISKMEEYKIPEDIIEKTVQHLPHLNRWKTKTFSQTIR